MDLGSGFEFLGWWLWDERWADYWAALCLAYEVAWWSAYEGWSWWSAYEGWSWWSAYEGWDGRTITTTTTSCSPLILQLPHVLSKRSIIHTLPVQRALSSSTVEADHRHGSCSDGVPSAPPGGCLVTRTVRRRGGRHDGLHAAQQLHLHDLAGHIVRQRRRRRRGRRLRALARRQRVVPWPDGLVRPLLGAHRLRRLRGVPRLRCSLGGAPPVTLAEFTLGGADGKDFYDVSLVDGYNVGIGVAATGAKVNSATCGYAGCVGDVNALCPAELQVAGKEGSQEEGRTVACRSACEAFGTAEYCCTGAHGGPDTCGPTRYSRLFKAACPAAYSYAYDDPTSTFTCGAGAQYLITFCPAQQ